MIEHPKRHMRHVGAGQLAIFDEDKEIKAIGGTVGWGQRDRDDVITYYNKGRLAEEQAREEAQENLGDVP